MVRKVQINAAKVPAVVAASEYRFGDATYGERAVARNGEINATSKKELLTRQMQFVQAASNGKVVSDAVFASAEQAAKSSKELLLAAFNNQNSHRVLGERMAESLYITANRQGFMRKYLTKITVEQGSIPRFPLRTKNVV